MNANPHDTQEFPGVYLSARRTTGAPANLRPTALKSSLGTLTEDYQGVVRPIRRTISRSRANGPDPPRMRATSAAI
jgi:hypothetical protein